ncbi:MAG: YkgJ family cysteine cluster protein [Treponemataceae bacterium]
MDIRDILPRGIEATSLGGPLSGLHRIYERIEESQSKWVASTPFRCPSGCGSCCDDFEPGLLEIEALYLAAWLLRTHRDRVPAIMAGFTHEQTERKGCVLASPLGEYHCTVYGGRPLVCRLFAYSGDRAKDGSARFRLCSRMTTELPRQFDEMALLGHFGLLPPIMADLAGEADSLLPDQGGERTPLRLVLPRAVAKIRHLADLTDSSAFSIFLSKDDKGDGDNDNPGGGLPPMSRAG